LDLVIFSIFPSFFSDLDARRDAAGGMYI
jgi:hypothetical protein